MGPLDEEALGYIEEARIAAVVAKRPDVAFLMRRADVLAQLTLEEANAETREAPAMTGNLREDLTTWSEELARSAVACDRGGEPDLAAGNLHVAELMARAAEKVPEKARVSRIDYPIPFGDAVVPCKGCGAPMVWRAKQPLSLRTARRRDNVWTCESHYSDCPEADRFRGKGKKS